MIIMEQLPEKIRVSTGTAIVLRLSSGKLDAAPTTAYLMTYTEGKCCANCSFCPQAKRSRGKADMLSRVSWPIFATKYVLDNLEMAVSNGMIRRVCLQAVNYPEVFSNLISLVRGIRQKMNVAVSVSCQPLNVRNIKLLGYAGVDRISIPLDAANKEIFDKVKGEMAGGPYQWDRQFMLLSEALKVFGKNNVSTHLIVGLGETEKDMVETIQQCVSIGVLPALFAFTPISGTAMENCSQPSIQAYRRIQLARYLILYGFAKSSDMRFNCEGEIVNFGADKQVLLQAVQTGKPFQTSGCPNCNRPYYNEKPSGPIYNFPRELSPKEISEVMHQLDLR